MYLEKPAGKGLCLLGALLIAASIAGCGDSNNSSASNGGNSGSAATNPTSALTANSATAGTTQTPVTLAVTASNGNAAGVIWSAPAGKGTLSATVVSGNVSSVVLTPASSDTTVNDTFNVTATLGSDTATIPVTINFQGTARFMTPAGIVMDASRNLYIADAAACKVRKISATGVVSTLAGSGTCGTAVDGTGTSAQFNEPYGIAIDSSSNVYVADSGNNTIRKISPAGVVTTLAGSSTSGSSDGTGTAAQFNGPSGVAVDSAGNVYVADTYNRLIRKITPAGFVSTLAGSAGVSGSADGTGAAATFYGPIGIAVDATGVIYAADGHAVRKITQTGVVTTFVGSTANGSTDGTGTSAKFSVVNALTVDGSGNVYVADTYNNEIRQITLTGVVTTLAGATTAGLSDGSGTVARFSTPFGIAFGTNGILYVSDGSNHAVRSVTTGGVVTTVAGAGSGTTDGSAIPAQ